MTCQILFLSCIKGFIIHSLQVNAQLSHAQLSHAQLSHAQWVYIHLHCNHKKKQLVPIKAHQKFTWNLQPKGGSNQPLPQAPFRKLGKGPGITCKLFYVCWLSMLCNNYMLTWSHGSQLLLTRVDEQILLWSDYRRILWGKSNSLPSVTTL